MLNFTDEAGQPATCPDDVAPPATWTPLDSLARAAHRRANPHLYVAGGAVPIQVQDAEGALQQVELDRPADYDEAAFIAHAAALDTPTLNTEEQG